MQLPYARLGVAVLISGLAGCQPMPQVASVELQTADATGIQDPFVFRVEAEPTDMTIEHAPTLSPLDAVKLALHHDPRIQMALARVRQSQAEAGQQRLLPNPVLDVSLRFPEGGGKSIIDAGITAELLSLIRKPGMISAADSRLRASSAEALTVVLDVIAEVQKQYATAQSLDARLQVLETRRSILQRLVDISQSRVEAGEAPRLDALTVQAERASLHTELLELQSEQRQARIALARMLGNPSGATDWALEPWQAPKMARVSTEKLIAAALDHRPEAQAHAWELEALGEEVKLAGISSLDGAQVGAAAERDGDWSAGPAVTIPLPLFDFGQEQRNAIEAKRVEARHQLTQTRRQIVQDVRQAIERVSSARAALDSVETDLLPLQQQRREQAENAYRLGFADITSVQLAEQDLQAGIGKRIELQEKLSIAWLELERAVGGSKNAARYVSPTTLSTQPQN